MSSTLTISSVIWHYIKMRGKTLKDVSADLGYNYKTLSGILKRNTVSAALLLDLANLLDMDLDWMAELFNHRRYVSSLAPLQIPRMQADYRTHNYKTILACLDRHIIENPGSNADTKRELLKDYPNLYYLLDILLPEAYFIRITVEQGRTKYYCHPPSDEKNDLFPTRGRSAISYRDGDELLEHIIKKRRDELK